MVNNRSWSWPGAVVAVLLGASAARGQPLANAFTYQGELVNAGTPAEGPHDLRFRLYDAAVGGSQLGAALCAENVVLADGRFTVSLDFGAQFAGHQRFLEIDVRPDTGLNCSNGTGFTTLSPRQGLSAAPSALFALNADTAANAGNAGQLNGQGAPFYRDASNLSSGTIPSARLSGAYTGVLAFSNIGNQFTGRHAGDGADLTALNADSISTGTLADARLSGNIARLDSAQTFSGLKTFAAAPSFAAAGAPFSVANATRVDSLNADLLDGLDAGAFLQSIPVPLTLNGNDAAHIIRGENASTTGVAVYGVGAALTGTTVGVYGQNRSEAGVGVIGLADNVDGFTIGVWGRSESPNGSGVFGQASAVSGGIGVLGESASSGGFAVRGRALATSGTAYGGYFSTPSVEGIAVNGYASASSGITTGVHGESRSTNGRGVYGRGTALTGEAYGGYFESASSSGTAVRGDARSTGGSTTTGVHGESRSLSGRGVHGLASAVTGFTFGGHFESSSTSGVGVFGHALADTGSTYGVYGRSQSSSGRAVSGHATSVSGIAYGGAFQSNSTSGIGVWARAASSTGTTYGGRFSADSPGGFGAKIENISNPNATVELAGPNGAFNTTGFVNREYTAGAPRCAIPIAYGSISPTGAIESGTGNFTVARVGVGQYDITINGESYSNTGYTVTITPVSNSPRFTAVADGGAAVRVNLWTASAVAVDDDFQFTVWKPNAQ